MSQLFALNQPLRSIFWPAHNKIVKEIGLVLFGIALLALSAQIVIPLQPVPLTFQSAMVVLIGMLYGARLSAFAVLGYFIAGSVGLPVFAHLTSGMGTFFGATSGYLIGFLPAAFLSGFLAQRGWAKNVVSAFAAACLGASVIFLFGWMMLSHLIGMQQAFLLGVAPFAVTEPLKLLAVALIAPRCWKIAK